MEHFIPLDDLMTGFMAVCTLFFAGIITVVMWRDKDKDGIMWAFTSVVTFLTVGLAVFIVAKGYAYATAHILYLP